MLTQGRLDYNLFYSLKILAHFRSKVLVDFLHYITRINCLTGAIISETHTTNRYIFITKYNPSQYSILVLSYCKCMRYTPLVRRYIHMCAARILIT
jgi:hypothetical protein